MKQYKLVISLLLVVSMFLLTACGSKSESTNGEKSDKIKIGFSIYGLGAEYANLLADSVKKEAEALGVEVVVLDGQTSVDTQISNLKNLASQKVDAIIVSPVDTDALSDTVDSIVDKGIPVIGVNNKMTAEKLSSYIGSPDVEVGEMAAEYIFKELSGKGNVVIMEGVIGQSSEVQRTEGIEKALKKYPDINVIAQKSANWSRAEGMSLMENLIQANPGKIDGVVAENDEMALGAINALKAKGMSVPVVGIDGLKDALTSIKNEELTASYYQNAKAQGQKAMQVAVEVVKGNSVEKEYNIPFELITKDNVEDYIK